MTDRQASLEGRLRMWADELRLNADDVRAVRSALQRLRHDETAGAEKGECPPAVVHWWSRLYWSEWVQWPQPVRWAHHFPEKTYWPRNGA